MTDFQTISLRFDGAVGRLTLERVGALNALSFEAMREIRAAIREVQENKSCSVLILEGEGRAFSVGFDLQALAGMMVGGSLPSKDDLREAAQLGEDMIRELRQLDVVTIASVHGFAIGGGFLLMSACDFRVVQEGTVFSIPEVDMGIPLLWGGVPVLVDSLGAELAKDVVMTCRKFGVEDLPANGFVYRKVSASGRADEVNHLARDLSQKPPAALRLTKQQFLSASGINLSGAPASDTERFAAAVMHPDFMTVAMAYIQRLASK